MTARRREEQQIIQILDEVDSGAKIAEVCHKHHVSRTTIHRWQKRYRANRQQEPPERPERKMAQQEAANELKASIVRLKQLQEENTRLRRIVVRQALDIDALQELAVSRND